MPGSAATSGSEASLFPTPTSTSALVLNVHIIFVFSPPRVRPSRCSKTPRTHTDGYLPLKLSKDESCGAATLRAEPGHGKMLLVWCVECGPSPARALTPL